MTNWTGKDIELAIASCRGQQTAFKLIRGIMLRRMDEVRAFSLVNRREKVFADAVRRIHLDIAQLCNTHVIQITEQIKDLECRGGDYVI